MSLAVPDFSAVQVLVIGDLMLDQYWFGPTCRISPEAPVPVVKVTGQEARPGGAANVGVNLASLGVETIVVGVTGSDANGATLKQLLSDRNIVVDVAESARHPTVTKLRVLSRNQQLIRLDSEHEFDLDDLGALDAILARYLSGTQVCVLSDYAKGTLGAVENILPKCRDHGVTALVDPKGTNFARYRGASVLTPNEAEFAAVVGPVEHDAQLIERGRQLLADLELDALVVTRGGRGMAVIPADDEAVLLPARAREVFDVTGAGDTVIATLAAGVGAGLALTEAAALANLAAGLVVRKIGVASVTPAELRLALHEHGQGGRGMLSRTEARRVAAEARGRGERIVMTNGCFDILHTGHVAYLEEAKSRGDRLIVAVNEDDSVARLKGPGRPINTVADRMAVLAGLASVDWVVPFSEDTPERLVGDILPDVLVKGGDYTPETIAGGSIVLANGGTVEVLSFQEGRSTSAIVEAIRKLS
jgi:D-beta-D-heptose 7-phosphate kinase/D-beta-D-heptose 1-phosphate adenosyltransferase